MTSQYQELAEILNNTEDLVITGHIDPDSDCVGSLLGLYHLFQGAKKGWNIVLQDDLPNYIKFLPGIELIKKPHELVKPPQAILMVDCNEVARAGQWLEAYWGKLPCYILDHHQGRPDAADMVICEPYVSACGELAARLALAIGRGFDKNSALCLYTAIAGDTGCFRYLNTSASCLKMASLLMETGINIEPVRINLYENLSPANIQMLSAALRDIEYYQAGNICVMALTRKDKMLNNASRSDCSGVVNFTLYTEGVKVGILLDEFEDFVKISLRSRDGYFVNQVAAGFGGGGHNLAAGCKIWDTLENSKQIILDKVREVLFNTVKV